MSAPPGHESGGPPPTAAPARRNSRRMSAGGDEFRRVVIKDQHIEKYHFMSNFVRTYKYTWYDFVPKVLFQLLIIPANAYFLGCAILQSIPAISALNPSSAWLPLIFVLGVSMVREGNEDLRRHRSDSKTNSKKAHILRNGEWKDVKWMEIQVGDLVKVENRETVPADLVVMHSSSADGKAFIQTASLDGETNMKPRLQVYSVASLPVTELVGLQMATEQPRGSLEEFDASIEVKGQRSPVEVDNFLPRESILRNCHFVVGCAVFTGHETRVMKGKLNFKPKRSAVDILINKLVLALIVFQVMLSLTCAVCKYLWDISNAEIWYLDPGRERAVVASVYVFFTYFLLFNTIIPISLVVTVEMVKFGQALFMSWDEDMKHVTTNLDGTEDVKFASWSTSTLNEEFGQVRYIFSDKTGTLTSNTMEFKACIVGVTRYGEGSVNFHGSQGLTPKSRRRSLLMECDTTKFDPRLIDDLVKAEPLHEELCVQMQAGFSIEDQGTLNNEFLLALALCQEVTPEYEEKMLIYTGLSPDEVCLVDSARNLGFTFDERTENTLRVTIEGRGSKTYDLLWTIKYTNSRKRSSVIVRCPDTGRITLYSKGADDTMMAACGRELALYKEETQAAVDAYSRLGLRTLAIAMKVITPEFWADWKARATEASCLMDKTEKEARLLELYKEVELDCLILGATGTEDKIQDGVPECIARMRQAKIAVWMITGDKLDTATEIAKSCRLIDSKEMRIDVCDEKKDVETGKKIISFGQEGGRQKYAIIISGVSLDHVFSNPQLTEHFYKYSVNCVAAVVCRATKMQKAQVVAMIKNRLTDVITLSIGDGANDVPMLKEAHVGVGIFGKEGTQAVQNSDVAIAQFRFLEKLLLYHGRWSYIRTCALIKYFFYKNVCFTMAQFYFALAAAWSGQTFFEDWYIASFNVLFTNLPVFAIGLMEYDARPELSETVRRNLPLLYSVGQLNLHFNRSALLRVWVQAYIHSVIIYMVAHFSVGPLVAGAGLVSNFWLSSHTAFGAVIIVVNVKIFTLMRSWTDLMVYSVLVSIFLYFFFFIVYDFIPFNKSYRTSLNAASTGVFWLAIIVSIVLCNLTDLGWQAYIRWFRPEQEDAAIEVQVVAQRDQRLMEKKGLIKKERGEDFGVREDER